MNLRKISIPLAISLALTAAPVLDAKVDEKTASKLGSTLTPLGAEKAGNKAGTIPAWNGGITSAPEGYDSSKMHIDPFATDKVLYTVTSENLAKHADKLSPGQLAMFKRYPDTFKMNVYTTRRSASYPQMVYDAAKKNATTAELNATGNGVKFAGVTSPFPIPNNGLEAIWNHLLRYRGGQISRTIGQAAPTASGKYVMVDIEETVYFPYNQAGATVESVNNRFAYFLQTVKSPARLAGNILLVHDTLDQAAEPRMAWSYNPGQRRVRRAPNIAYDFPGTASDNQRTTDQFDMFNGSPDRYNWTLNGKKEMLVPYNSFKAHSSDIKASDLLRTGHLNSDHLRYELHRVWEVEASIKKGTSHIYPRKTYYLDEDSWGILVADQYDGRENMWRLSEAHVINYYQVPMIWDTLQVHYDLLNGRYLAFGFNNQGPVDKFDINVSKKDFTPSTLRRSGRR